MSYSTEAWKCSVTLKLLDEENRIHSKPFGDDITLSSCVEERVFRAQLAILAEKSTEQNYETFLSKSVDDLQKEFPDGAHLKERFTFDAIALEISGPEVTDLSFIDLPGECIILAE